MSLYISVGVNPAADGHFSMDKFSVNEETLHIWTSLFYLASQVIRVNWLLF